MEIEAQNAIYLGEETGGRGRQFRARFLVPGLVKYDYGVCLLTKENADKFIQGFTGCPVVINHQNVTDDNVKDVAVGDIFSVWFDNNDGYYWCNGIIRDKEAIKLINEGYSVSCQYLITEYSDNTKGALHNGNPYDKVIENGKPEHLAIVNNPRYEGAIIAVNAILAENEDKWITIHPNGEENKGRHLLIKDGESVEDAMHRNGWYKKRQAKEDKGGKEKSILDIISERDRQAKELKEKGTSKDIKMPKSFAEKQQEDIDKGELVELGKFPTKFTSEYEEYKPKDKQPDKEEKGEETLDDKIKEHENKIPKNYRRDIKTKALWLYKNSYITRTEFEKVQTASNSFVSQFKDTLYTVLAEGIYNRLLAINAGNWVTMKKNGKTWKVKIEEKPENYNTDKKLAAWAILSAGTGKKIPWLRMNLKRSEKLQEFLNEPDDKLQTSGMVEAFANYYPDLYKISYENDEDSNGSEAAKILERVYDDLINDNFYDNSNTDISNEEVNKMVKAEIEKAKKNIQSDYVKSMLKKSDKITGDIFENFFKDFDKFSDKEQAQILEDYEVLSDIYDLQKMLGDNDDK